MPITKEEIDAMSNEEKRQLLEMIWDSFGEYDENNHTDDLPEETEEELQILQERLEEYRRNPSSAIPWEKLKDELMKRHHD
ncbi:MAG TPA: addiction module protein [Chitinophagaceae bacterium]|jgi:putative addiction module component (TIGR02574 family)